MKKHFSISYKNGEESAERRFAYAMASGFTETAFSLSGGMLSPEEPHAARTAGLLVEALRLPTDGVNLIWETPGPKEKPEDWLPTDGRTPDETTWEMLRSLYDSYFSFAAGIGIGRVILVPTAGVGVPPVSQTGLSRMRELAALARERGVRLLIENDRSAPHFEAAVRVVSDGYHGVSFSPAKAWRYHGTSALPPYAAEHLLRLSLDDGKGDDFGYLPLEGDTDFRPFARSMANVRFRGTMAIAPDASLLPYRTLDTFTLLSRAYDNLATLMRMIKEEEGTV